MVSACATSLEQGNLVAAPNPAIAAAPLSSLLQGDEMSSSRCKIRESESHVKGGFYEQYLLCTGGFRRISNHFHRQYSNLEPLPDIHAHALRCDCLATETRSRLSCHQCIQALRVHMS